MGTLSRLPWWRRAGRARAQRSRSRRSSGSASRDSSEQQFGELSGGQRQRVLVARALVQDAAVLLLDEPFTGVDLAERRAARALLGELAAEGRGILIATHDLEQALALGPRALPQPPAVAFGRPEATLTRDVLEQTYGGAIVALPGEPGAVGILPPHHHDHEATSTDARARSHPWTLGFMQRALLELVLVGVVAGVLGCWIVLYELAYSAESLAHSLFPGLVAGRAARPPARARRRARRARRGGRGRARLSRAGHRARHGGRRS